MWLHNFKKISCQGLNTFNVEGWGGKYKNDITFAELTVVFEIIDSWFLNSWAEWVRQPV